MGWKEETAKLPHPQSGKPHVDTGCERFGAEQRQEAPAFDISPTPSKANPFEELAATLVEYDTVDLLSAVAALQFLPQNAGRVTRLEALAPNILQRLEARPFSFLLIPQVDSQGGLPANVDSSHFMLVTSYTSNRSDWLNSESVNIFDGEIYRLALEQIPKLDKVIPRTYGHVLFLDTKHPEAKSLAPNGSSCTCDTGGMLQRSSVVAASRRYVGKEADRRWEQGEDLSLVEFKAVEYQGSKQVETGSGERRNQATEFSRPEFAESNARQE